MSDPAAFPYELHVREVSDVVVIEVLGDLTVIAAPIGPLKNVVQEKIDQGHRKFLVNLANLSSVDSSGVGLIVMAIMMVQDASGELWFCEPRDRVRQIFSVPSHSPFQLHDNCEEALGELQNL